MQWLTIIQLAILGLQGVSGSSDHDILGEVVAQRPRAPFNLSDVDDLAYRLDRRQDDLAGRCGPDYNDQVCPGAECCSMYGWCGTGDEHCNTFGCKADYGWCEGEPLPEPTTSAPPPPPPPTTTSTPPPVVEPTTTPTPVETSAEAPEPPESTSPAAPPAVELTVSPDGTCGNGTTCTGSTFGRCCSNFYWCGSSEDHCNEVTCRPEFGECGEEPPPLMPPEGFTMTEDGICGNTTSCLGSQFGNCCSKFYWCGEGEDFCGSGCRPELGQCDDMPEVPSLPVSTTGMCGNGTTCMGSGFGDCCSYHYWCGNSDDYCTGKCRPEWGNCA